MHGLAPGGAGMIVAQTIHPARFHALFLSCLATFLGVLLPDRAEARTWTNDQGQTIEADFVRYRGKTVILREDGKIHRVPYVRLSEADQAFAEAAGECSKYRDWTTSQGRSIRGKYQSHDGDEVVFKTREDEQRLTYHDLIPADQELLMKFTEGAIGEAAGSRPDALVLNEMLGSARGGDKRVWTDVSGKEIIAEYRGVEGEKVVLFFKDREWRVPLARLSEADQAFVSSRAEPQTGESLADAGRNSTSLGEPLESPVPNDEPKNIRVETRNGRTRVWADNREVFGAEAARVAALLERRQMDRVRTHDDFMKEAEQRMADARREHENRVRGMEEESRKTREQRGRELAERMASRQSPRPQFETPSVQPPHVDGVDMETPEPVSMAPPSSLPSGPPQPQQMVNVYQCFSCDHEWETVREFGVGDKCPKCGVRFDEEYDESGKLVDETSGASTRRMGRTIRRVIFGVVMVASFIGWLSRKISGSDS